MNSDRDIINEIVIKLQDIFKPENFRIRKHVSVPGPRGLVVDILVDKISVDGSDPFLAVEADKGMALAGEKQLFSYVNALGIKYGAISDGQNFIYYEKVGLGKFIEIPNIPLTDQENVSFNKDTLNPAENLSFKLAKITWIISDYARGAYSPPEVFAILQKILICKIIDESRAGDPLFTTRSTEHFMSGINRLFQEAKTKYPDIFSPYDKIDLDEHIMHQVVLELESYSISKSRLDSRRNAYQELTRKLLDRRMPSYTPDAISDMIVNLVKPSPSLQVLDATAGIGSFLTRCIIYRLEEYKKGKAEEGWEQKWSNIYSNLYGIERGYNTAITAKINLVLQGGNPDVIRTGDFLSMESPFRGQKFDIIFANPPFGVTIEEPIVTVTIWPVSSRRAEILFALRALEHLKEGGQLAIIVPESFLFSSSAQDMRQHLLMGYDIEAIIGFPSSILAPSTSIPVSLLLIRKPYLSNNRLQDKRVFMASLKVPNFSSSRDNLEINDLIQSYHLFRAGNQVDDKVVENEKSNFFVMPANELDLRNWTFRYNYVKRFAPLDDTKNWIPIDELVEIQGGISISSNKYHNEPAPDRLPYIRISDIIDGKLSAAKVKYVNPEDVKNVAKYVVKEGDILVSIRGTIGKVAIVDVRFNNAVVSTQLAILRVRKAQTIDTRYLYYVLISTKVKEQTNNFKTGYYIQGLSMSDLSRVRIPLPPISEQQRIVEQIEKEAEDYQRALDHVRKTMPERIQDILRGIEKQ